MKVIICEYHPWDSAFKIGNHHYARQFLDDGWEVLWISHPVSPFHGLKPENKERMERAMLGPVAHIDGPTELVPYTRLPFINKPFLSSRWVLENSLKYCRPPLLESLKKAGREGFDKPDLIWITDTVMHSIADIADAKALVVRIADDNTEFKNNPKTLMQIEGNLQDRADVVFVTSSPLEDRLRPVYGSKVHLLRNGVNYEHFHDSFERPKEYEGVEGPVAVYVGAIEEWFEPEWVDKLANAGITVALIGKVGINTAGLESNGNVLLIGQKPYEEIPSYLAHADVGIIPFKRTRLVESVSPLKLFEFLAAGLPVVSAKWDELERLGSPSMLASDGDEFVRMVRKCADEKLRETKGNEYREYASENSWSGRYEFAMGVLEKYLK